MVGVSAYMGGARGSGVLSSACGVLEMSVVRGVGGVCDMGMFWLGAGWEVLGVSGCKDWARVWEGWVVLSLCML